MITRYFTYKAKNSETKRVRSVTVDADNENEAIEKLKAQGFLEPFELQREGSNAPSDAQLDYAKKLGVKIPKDANIKDASALIAKAVDNDSDPNPDLVEYANELGLTFSQYIGKRALYGLVYRSMDLKEQIAFFVFCVYRWLSDDRGGNLNKHQHRQIFYDFAEQYVNDAKFVKSLAQYSGEDIRFFGKITYSDGNEYYGGSASTLAYKTCAAFLKERFGLQNKTSIRLKGKGEGGSERSNSKKPKDNTKGCAFGVVAFSILFVLGISVVVFRWIYNALST